MWNSFHSINVPSEWGLETFLKTSESEHEVSIQLMSPASGDKNKGIRVFDVDKKVFPFN